MSFNNSNPKSQEEKWIIILGILATIILASILILFVVRLNERNAMLPNIADTKTVVSKIMGEGKEYLPSINELPNGFKLMESKGEPRNLDNGNYYQSTYTNSGFLFQQREVNVLYTVSVLDSISIAEQTFVSLLDPASYQGQGEISTTKEPFSIEDFTNVDEVGLLFGNDITELGTNAISYTLVFRFQNFIGHVIVSAPVDSFDDAYAKQLRERLRKAVVFYSSLVTNKLPVHHLVITLDSQPVDNIAAQTTSLATKVPTNTKTIIFEDNFENPKATLDKWSSLGGSWFVEACVLRCGANGKYLANSQQLNNFNLQLDIMGKEVVDKIIVFRFIDEDNAYGIDFRSNPYNDLVLVKSVSGNTGQTVQTGSIQNYNETWYKVMISAVGDHIQVFINDQIIIDYTDTSSPILEGKVGVGAMLHNSPISAVYYDNVVLTTP